MVDVVNLVPMGSEIRGIKDAWTDGHLGVDDVTAPISAALSGLGMFLDPVNWVVGKLLEPILNWILNNLPPCKKAMDALTGSVEGVQSWAQSFQDASRQVAEAATEVVNTTKAQLESWKGDGAEAYRQAQQTAVELQRSIADKLHSTYDIALALADLVAVIKEVVVGLIKELVTDLVTKGVMAALAAVPSLGSAVAAYMAWAAGKYAVVMGKVATWFQKLFSKAADKFKNIQLLNKLFTKAADGFGKLAGRFQQMKAGADKAADSAKQARDHQKRAERRRERANEHYANAEEKSGRPARTERRKGDTQARRAEEQQSKSRDANKRSYEQTGGLDAGASTQTKVGIGKTGEAVDDKTHSHEDNPADSIPTVS